MKIISNIIKQGLLPQAIGKPQKKFTQKQTQFLASNGSTYPALQKTKWSPGQVAQTLGNMTKSIAQLKAELKHKDLKVRQKALSELGNLHSRCITALRFRHPDTSTRTDAARILGKIGWASALRALSDVVYGNGKDPHPQVRESAVYAIGLIIESKSIDTLLVALNDTHVDVRGAAVQMLINFKSFKDKRIVPALTKMMSGFHKDPCPLIRREAVHVLERLGDSQAVSALNSALTDGDIKVKKLAATALGKFGDKKSVKPLTALLFGPKRDASAEVRKKVAAALGDIGGSRAITALIRLVTGPTRDPDSSVRINALWGLKTTKDSRCISALKTALRDPSPFVRKDAAELLHKLKRRR
jgi:HEAT repeat protein